MPFITRKCPNQRHYFEWSDEFLYLLQNTSIICIVIFLHIGKKDIVVIQTVANNFKSWSEMHSSLNNSTVIREQESDI